MTDKKKDGGDDKRKSIIEKIKEQKKPFDGVQWSFDAPGWEILYKGTYSHEALYKSVFQFLESKGFKALPPKNKEGKMADDKYETFYEDRNVNGFREILYQWRAKRMPVPECEQYIYINAHLLGHSKQEVLVEGQKIKMDNVELDIWVRGGFKWLFLGKKSPIAENVFGKSGEKLYLKPSLYLDYRSTIEGKFYDDFVELHDIMMQILGLPPHRGARLFQIDRRGNPMLSTEAPLTDPHPDK